MHLPSHFKQRTRYHCVRIMCNLRIGVQSKSNYLHYIYYTPITSTPIHIVMNVSNEQMCFSFFLSFFLSFFVPILFVCLLGYLFIFLQLQQFDVRSLGTYIDHKGILKASCPKWIKQMTLRTGLLTVSGLLMVFIRLRLMQFQLPIFTR